jgi:hypothetical protein
MKTLEIELRFANPLFVCHLAKFDYSIKLYGNEDILYTSTMLFDFDV